jgi:hypothetical protein
MSQLTKPAVCVRIVAPVFCEGRERCVTDVLHGVFNGDFNACDFPSRKTPIKIAGKKIREDHGRRHFRSEKPKEVRCHKIVIKVS